jgi:transcriptional regulator with XRE-family HTH domain
MDSNSIGAALRAVRKQKRLSLAEVAARSGSEFKPSSLGAYERGDRAISVQRLQRLARIYGVSPDALLRTEPRNEIDLTRLEKEAPSGLVLDLSHVRTVDSSRAIAVMSFANAIKRMRSESTSSVIVVRRSDAATLAALIGCDPADVEFGLSTPGILADLTA